MSIAEINEWYKRLNGLLSGGRLLEAFESINTVLSKNNFSSYASQLDELLFTYTNMLNFTMQGVSDPQSEKIYLDLINKAYELADLVKLDLLNSGGHGLGAIKADLEKHFRRNDEDLADSLMNLSFDYELTEILRESELYDDETESESALRHRQTIQRIFNYLWLNNRFSEADARVIGQIFESAGFPWYEKSLLVSAITLGLVRSFDVKKLEILAKLYSDNNPLIAQRALVGVMLTIGLHNNRLVHLPKAIDMLKVMADDVNFESDAFSVISQIIRSKDAEKISRRFKEDIIPDIIRFNEDLSRKLNLENLLSTGDETDKNPDWEKYFDNESELVRKLEELTNMQMEGADVFLGAFSMLKNFPFFRELHHWFMPFYRENFAVVTALKNEDSSFREIVLKGVENSPYMCNSDKFSFILNLSFLPQQQKEMMSQMLGAEIEQFEEIMNEELTDPALRKKRLVIQYIQDLYRFFRLNPLKNEIGDVFQQPLDIYNTTVFEVLVKSSEFYRKVATFCFDNDHFGEAYIIITKLLSGNSGTAELYEKAGYSLQKTGDYQGALELYRKADLFDTNRKWLLGKMAQCHLKLLQPAEALTIYNELLLMEPDNNKIIASAGTCYLNLGDYEKALECFFRIEFNSPGEANAIRPLAWSLFLLNRNEEAAVYYGQLLGMDPNEFDFMNAGHVAWCQGKRLEAASHYKNSIRKRNGDLKTFLRAFASDKPFLLKNGLSEREIQMMLDFISLNLK
ncbi:MAG: tetratricopeptide repeat protein [Bacteroidales bacterium]|nr:tetratricopeptide repeat protein [Bacteroidales bacterium]